MSCLRFGSFVLLLSWCAGCGDDSTGTDAGSSRDSGRVDGGGPRDSGGSDEDAGELADAGDDEDAGGGMTDAGTDAGSTPTSPPEITRIAWMTSRPCAEGMTSTFTITVDVTDADTPAGSLTYMGSVGGCTGMITSSPATITCPNIAPYRGNITVRDPEGNMDMAPFMFGPCSAGEVMP